MTIYFDNNSTTKVKPEVQAEVARVLDLGALNPSSIHANGRLARKIIDDARAKVAEALGVTLENYNVIFTGSGSEANNMAIRAIAGVERVVVSEIEHLSVLAASATAPDSAKIPVDETGVVILSKLEKTLQQGGKSLVSVMAVNNETGVIQPVEAAAEIAHKHGGIFHTDAVQAIGKIAVNYAFADVVTIAAHKFGGSPGIGAIAIKKGIKTQPLIVGGGQEFGLRAGTHNVAAIAGMAKAIELIDLAQNAKIAKLRDKIEHFQSGEIYGKNADRVANTTCIAMPGRRAEMQLIEFDLGGICVSAGAACSSGKVQISHVLKAMGAAHAGDAIRVSLAAENTESEVDEFIKAWKNLYERTQKIAA